MAGIFIGERIDAIDKRIRELRPNRRIKPGVLVVFEVYWTLELATAKGEVVAAIQYKLPARYVQNESITKVAAEVIKELGERFEKLREAVKLAVA